MNLSAQQVGMMNHRSGMAEVVRQLLLMADNIPNPTLLRA
jgi:hypothetical protein